ncbi:MAG: TIGR01777 family oxidoreductase [Bernardetiaceae bacterium]|nr:TIGR01777 family oxidoreductase [Bernardetiaceae bacterium]
MNVLITGGTGVVGQRLAVILLNEGHQVAVLSRDKRPAHAGVATYQWDIARGYLDPAALAWATHVVHLAGAGVADQRWTEARKKEILESRTRSTQLLAEALKAKPNQVQAVVGASAIGIYGHDTGQAQLDENSPAARDFLSEVVKAWEAATDGIAAAGYRTVKLRIGIVLSHHGGALEKMAQPVRLYTGAALGTGQQWLSWIHVDDLCRLIIYGLENPHLQGVYNAVGPQPATNEQMTRAIAQVLHRPVLPLNVPAFALRLALGPLADLVLGGSHVSAAKIQAAGFQFKFPELGLALRDLLKP